MSPAVSDPSVCLSVCPATTPIRPFLSLLPCLAVPSFPPFFPIPRDKETMVRFGGRSRYKRHNKCGKNLILCTKASREEKYKLVRRVPNHNFTKPRPRDVSPPLIVIIPLLPRSRLQSPFQKTATTIFLFHSLSLSLSFFLYHTHL